MLQEERLTCLRVGDKVGNFELQAYDPSESCFKTVRLSEITTNRKWTVLFFYPADYTFVCPTELADLAHYTQKIRDLGCEVISVSTDTQYVHMAWQRDEKLLKDVTFLMGADPTRRLSKMFGVYDESTGLALRGTFIINQKSELVGSEINFYNVGRNAEELVRKLAAYMYVDKNPNHVCPANWKEGAKVLKPGPELVGKVGEALV